MLAASTASDQPMPPPQVASTIAEAGGEAGQRDRALSARHAEELVQRERARDQREHEHGDPAQVHRAERHRREQRCDEHAAEEVAHRAPKRRRRPAYSASAARSGSSPKSGHSVGVNTYSL